MESGMITQGKKVDQFEDELAVHLQNKYVLTLNSGTAALHLALRLANVGPGDEVITTPMTCVATNVPIVWERARIVWADVHPKTGLIDPADVAAKITRRTKAIISVDWSGSPVDYFTLRQLAEQHGITFISDAAHSLGAFVPLNSRYIPVGSGGLAHMTAFSLQAIKTITTIDGGILSLSDEKAYRRGKRLRWFGVPRDNDVEFRGALDVEEVGLKMHMNDVAATIGIEALTYLVMNVGIQRNHAQRYFNNLNWSIPGSPFELQPLQFGSTHWLMVVLLPDPQRREEFRLYMKDNNIEVSQVHWRNDKHTAFKEFQTPLPGVDQYSSRMICVPVNNRLTLQDIDHIVSVMNAFAE